MNNIFLQNKPQFHLKKEPLQKIIQKETNPKIKEIIQEFFENHEENQKYLQCANLVLSILEISNTKEAIQKLLNILVFFSTVVQHKQFISILQKIKKLNLKPYTLVRFFSFVFKSVQDKLLKKWLVFNTVQAIKKQEKTSSFTSFVQNFDVIVGQLDLNAQELLQLYFQLISYLQGNLIQYLLFYQSKKLLSIYIFKTLSFVNQQNCKSDKVNSILIKAINLSNFQQDSIELLNNQSLKKNKLFTILQARITGNPQKASQIDCFQQYKLNKSQILKKIKIEQIPRLFKNINQASYSQAALLLGIQKKNVQSYIIQAVRLGIMKAKLDEFQQTIIINSLNLRCLQKSQQIQLQKEISDVCSRLEKIE